MANTIFGNTTPVITSADDGTDYTLATKFRRSTSGTIIAGRWFFPNPLPVGTTTWVLYDDATQAELARQAFVAPVAGAWNVTPDLAVPVTYTADVVLRAAIYTPGDYVATINFFSGPLVNDDITAPADNGWLSNVDSFPSNQSGNAASYFADVVFASGASNVSDTLTPPGLALPAGGHLVTTAGRDDRLIVAVAWPAGGQLAATLGRVDAITPGLALPTGGTAEALLGRADAITPPGLALPGGGYLTTEHGRVDALTPGLALPAGGQLATVYDRVDRIAAAMVLPAGGAATFDDTPADPVPGVITVGGRPASTITAGGRPASTITAGGA